VEDFTRAKFLKLAIMPVDEVYLTPKTIARLVGAPAALVCAWIDMGQLEVDRTAGGNQLISPSALRAFLIEQAMPVPFGLLGAKSLLIIDDDANLLRSTARLLRQTAPDLKVEMAEGALRGLAQAAKLRPDAVLLDAYMPVMGGIEVCKRLKADPQTARIQIVAITGDSSGALAAEFKSAGAVAFLEKPVNARILFDVLSTDLNIQVAQ